MPRYLALLMLACNDPIGSDGGAIDGGTDAQVPDGGDDAGADAGGDGGPDAGCTGSRCDGACVDLMTDTAHCGACGNDCAAAPNTRGAVCIEGECSYEGCAPGFSNCDGESTVLCDTATADAARCGDCLPCPSAFPECTADGDDYTCTNDCTTGQRVCGGACTDTTSDALHCGDCDQPCPLDPNGTPRCSDGACHPICNSGYHECGGVCVSNNSVAHCGSRCEPCAPRAGYRAQCVAGSCIYQCVRFGGCGPCDSDDDCQGLSYCDGYEQCVGVGIAGADDRGCAPGTPVRCIAGTTCDESARACVGQCGGADVPLGSGGGEDGRGGGGGARITYRDYVGVRWQIIERCRFECTTAQGTCPTWAEWCPRYELSPGVYWWNYDECFTSPYHGVMERNKCRSDSECYDGYAWQRSLCTAADYTCDPADPAADCRGCVAHPTVCPPGFECHERRAGLANPFVYCAGDPPELCTSDGDCTNGLFCDGVERCAPSDPSADSLGCVRSDSACALPERCDELRDRCVPLGCDVADLDGDGVDSIVCGGSDCDDNDRNRYPGNPEVCDANGHDEDCIPCTVTASDTGDEDLDGHTSEQCWNEWVGVAPTCDASRVLVLDGVVAGRDCDDANPSRHHGLPEVCNGVDDDCDRLIDEGVGTLFYRDRDGDGYGVATCGRYLCALTPGYVANTSDCDDGNPSLQSGSQICDWNGANGTRRCELGAWSGVTFCPSGQFCGVDTSGAGRCE